jgi:hypothetical protein
MLRIGHDRILPRPSGGLPPVPVVRTAHHVAISLIDAAPVYNRNSSLVVTLRCWIVPNIGRQFILERCIHGVAEQFQRRIWAEGYSALHN